MKKAYIAPELSTEVYELNSSIAANCVNTVTNGPALGNHSQCKDYVSPFAISTYSEPKNVSFYEDAKDCDCYTTTEDGKYWTS